MSIPTQPNARQTAHQARSLVLRHVQAALGPIAQGVAQWLDRLPDPAESSERIQANEDMRRAWLGASRTWQAEAAQRLLTSPGSTGQGASVKGELRLLDEEDVEMQILAGRLAQVLDEGHRGAHLRRRVELEVLGTDTDEHRAIEDRVLAQDIAIVNSQRPEWLPLDLQAELAGTLDRRRVVGHDDDGILAAHLTGDLGAALRRLP